MDFDNTMQAIFDKMLIENYYNDTKRDMEKEKIELYNTLSSAMDKLYFLKCYLNIFDCIVEDLSKEGLKEEQGEYSTDNSACLVCYFTKIILLNLNGEVYFDSSEIRKYISHLRNFIRMNNLYTHINIPDEIKRECLEKSKKYESKAKLILYPDLFGIDLIRNLKNLEILMKELSDFDKYIYYYLYELLQLLDCYYDDDFTNRNDKSNDCIKIQLLNNIKKIYKNLLARNCKSITTYKTKLETSIQEINFFQGDDSKQENFISELSVLESNDNPTKKAINHLEISLCSCLIDINNYSQTDDYKILLTTISDLISSGNVPYSGKYRIKKSGCYALMEVKRKGSGKIDLYFVLSKVTDNEDIVTKLNRIIPINRKQYPYMNIKKEWKAILNSITCLNEPSEYVEASWNIKSYTCFNKTKPITMQEIYDNSAIEDRSAVISSKFACCERKLFAHLSNKMMSSDISEITMFIKYKPCDDCDSAIKDMRQYFHIDYEYLFENSWQQE